MISTVGRISIIILYSLLLSACGQLISGSYAMKGKGGTYALTDEMSETKKRASQLAPHEPKVLWQSSFSGYASDVITFIDKDLVLVGSLNVEPYNHIPSTGPLSLYNLQTQTLVWEASRKAGDYTLIPLGPTLLMVGKNQSQLWLSGINIKTGDNMWSGNFDSTAKIVAANNERVIISSRQSISAFNAKTGNKDWEHTLDGPAIELRADGNMLLAVTRNTVNYFSNSGTLAWSANTHFNDFLSTHFRKEGIVISDAFTTRLISRKRGHTIWSSKNKNGNTHLVVSNKNNLFRVRNVISSNNKRSHLDRVDLKTGKTKWTYNLKGDIKSSLIQTSKMVLMTTESRVIGIHRSTGRRIFQQTMPQGFHWPKKSDVEMALPDELDIKPNTLIVSRESIGVLAFDLPSGQLAWAHKSAAVDELNRLYTLSEKTNELNHAIKYYGGKFATQAVGYKKNLSGFSIASIKSAQIRATQAQNKYQQMYSSRSSSVLDVNMAAFKSNQAQRDVDFQKSMQTLNTLSNLGISLLGSVEQYRHTQAQISHIQRRKLALDGAALSHLQSVQQDFFLRPFVATGVGMSIIDLNTGLRSNVTHSPVIDARVGFGIDRHAITISPDGKTLVTVGIGLAANRYQPFVTNTVRQPKSSILVYDLDTIKARQKKQNRSLSALRTAAASSHLAECKRLIIAGADVNYKDPNYHNITPLMEAVAANSVAVTRLLLKHGANVKTLNSFGSSAYTMNEVVTKNPEIEKLLRAAGEI